MLVINLFGVPSSVKSTGAAYIFSQLKMKGFNVELITEFAKDKVWENNTEVFKNQAYLFGKQSFKMAAAGIRWTVSLQTASCHYPYFIIMTLCLAKILTRL